MIEAQNLSKKYGDFVALDNVNFSVKRGEIIGLLGPNGAGKSTTMKIMSAFMPASSGSVKIGGFDVFEEPQEVKKRVGYLPEDPPLYLDMKIMEYLKFVCEIKQIPKKDHKDRIDYVIQNCGLGTHLKHVLGALSKGFKQRVGIAQAIIHKPDVIILDEPTVGLDPIQIVEIRNFIKSLGQDHTVVLSTHILPEVQMTCDRILMINKGKIISDTSLESFESAKSGSFEEAYVKIIAGDSTVNSAMLESQVNLKNTDSKNQEELKS